METDQRIWRFTVATRIVMKELNVTPIDQRLVKQSRTGDGQNGLTMASFDRGRGDLKVLKNASITKERTNKNQLKKSVFNLHCKLF